VFREDTRRLKGNLKKMYGENEKNDYAHSLRKQLPGEKWSEGAMRGWEKKYGPSEGNYKTGARGWKKTSIVANLILGADDHRGEPRKKDTKGNQAFWMFKLKRH